MYDLNDRWRFRKLDEPRDPSSALNLLPFAATAGMAYRFVGAGRNGFLAYATAPVLFTSLLMAVAVFSDIAQTDGGVFAFWGVIRPELVPRFPLLFAFSSTTVATAISVVFGALYFAAYILFAVAWHRRYLVGRDQTSYTEVFSWRFRHARFLWRGVVVVILGPALFAIFWMLLGQLLGLVIPAGTSGQVRLLIGIPLFALTVFVMIWAVSVWVSFVLIFPAAAVEDPRTGYRASRELTRGYKWHIFSIIVFGIWVPLGVVSFVFERLAMDPGVVALWTPSTVLSVLFVVITNLIIYVGFAVGITALSIIYKTLIANAADETATETKQSL